MKEWLAEYFATARTPMTAIELAQEFEQLGKHAPGWPRATRQNWKREIEQSIERGELVTDKSGYVRAAPKPDDAMKQLSLFD